MTHLYNAMPGITHRAPGPIVAAAETEGITAELICDGIHSHPAAVRFAFATFGADRIILISDSTRATGMPDGEYDLGGLPVMVAAGAARLKDNAALAGSVLRMNIALKNVVEITGLPLSEAVRAGALNAAHSLNLRNIGRIETGFAADVALIDDNFIVHNTFVDGEMRYALD